MKSQITLLLAILAFIAASCSGKRPVLENIRSKKTAAHLNVDGTRVFMVVPPGFSITKNFTGFIRDRDCSMQIIESKGENVRKVFSTYSEKAFASRGKEILESKKILVNEYAGKLVVVPGERENSETLYLLFGDHSFSVLLTANYKTVEKKTREEIYQAIRTIYLDRNFKSAPIVGTLYSFLDDTFKFCERIPQLDLYTADGNLKSLQSTEPVVMVSDLEHMQNVTLEQMAKINLQAMEKQQARITGVNDISSQPVSGYEAFSRTVSFTLGKDAKTSYQVFIKKGERIVIVQGVIFNTDLNRLEEIKQFVNSIQVKAN